MFPEVNKNRNLGIVPMDGEDILTVATTGIDGFKKYYLGQTGIVKIISSLSESWLAKLKPGWQNARFAVVVKEKTDCVIGTVVEYQNGTFVLLTGFNGRQEDKRKTDLDKFSAEYILAEFKRPFVKELKSWEEIPASAAIKEAFTSRETNTGLWGQSVPVVNFNCNDCLKCYIQCPDESIYRNPITGIAELADITKCKACGICAEVCIKDAITMVAKSEVKAAQSNVFIGIFGKRMEIIGPSVKEEVEQLKRFSPEELVAKGYAKLYEDLSGKKSLSGNKIIQLRYYSEQPGEDTHPLLATYISQGDAQWTKIIRPLTNILVYGFTDYELELASAIQLEGFNVTAIPSATDGFNFKKDKFINAGYTSELTLEKIIESPGYKFDAVVTAYYENVSKDVYLKIMEKFGVFLAPFMRNFSRDPFLDKIVNEVQCKMFNLSAAYPEDDRPLAKVISQERDISSGHRACVGCPIDSTFNLAMQSVREAYDTPEEKIEIVNSGATGCAEVISSVFPDTSWKKFLHTTFGGLGANLEGMNAAYRFLRKTGKIKKQYKFFGWAGDGGTYDIGLQALSGYLERGLATDCVYVCYDNGAYMNTGVQRSSATPLGAGTSTSPIGEIIQGKPQFRKNLSDFAAAHEGIYVATVCIAFEMDFKRKLQKAAKHNGPALIIAYSNCTTGHGTAVDLTVEQSLLAVESGYWPLFEIENGEKKISYEPNFIRRYETALQKIQSEFKSGKKEKQQLLTEMEAAKKEYQDEFLKNLTDWLKSEGRFALHFSKDGKPKNVESVSQILHLLEELKIEWNKLRLADTNLKRKEKLVSILVENLREQDKNKREELQNDTTAPFGIKVGMMSLEKFLENESYFNREGIEMLESKAKLFLNIKRQINPEAYFEIYEDELNKYNIDKPELTETLRQLAASLHTNYFVEQEEKADTEQKAAVSRYKKFQKIKSRIKSAHSIEYTRTMDETEKQKNRIVLGFQPVAGRIFARAGDGGVTSAKLFVSLLGQIG
ncbi:MAG TPA: thiamine pyrophosphate-dependent enzyme, partial [Bacteroidia bacterium]|nr:thiamine pyrophosphate-dependent enzyme [Bacteroidia bacterium]